MLETNVGAYIQNMIRKKKTLWPVRASNNYVSLARTGPTATNIRRASAYCGGLLRWVQYVGLAICFPVEHCVNNTPLGTCTQSSISHGHSTQTTKHLNPPPIWDYETESCYTNLGTL